MVIQGPSYSYNSLHIQIEKPNLSSGPFLLFFPDRNNIHLYIQNILRIKRLEIGKMYVMEITFSQLLSDPIFIRHSIMKMYFFNCCVNSRKNQNSVMVGNWKNIFIVNTTMIVKQTPFWSIGTWIEYKNVGKCELKNSLYLFSL